MAMFLLLCVLLVGSMVAAGTTDALDGHSNTETAQEMLEGGVIQDPQPNQRELAATGSPPTPAPATPSSGLLNEGKPCYGKCNKQAGDCPFCGTGQCCRKADYNKNVPGCEKAENVRGSACGHFRGKIGLKNKDKGCWGFCNSTAGDCLYCGTGQCCRRADADNCVPGCELAGNVRGAVCGLFKSTSVCSPLSPAPAPSNTNPAPPDTSSGSASAPSTSDTTTSDLLNVGRSCMSHCGFAGGDCDFCGTGQCCQHIDWYRGVYGCELAQDVQPAVCGHYKQPHPEPKEFRLQLPAGTAETPVSGVTPEHMATDWIGDIVVEEGNDKVPPYFGEGGQPWSRFEIVQVRDLLLREIRRASTGRDELGAAKFLRLAFHDCLRHTNGQGGCDGCLNFPDFGFEFGGENRRVEDRELEDHERKPNHFGLEEALQFLEYIYTLDLGMVTKCWATPATVVGGQRIAGPITVNSAEACQQLCQNTINCTYFTVPQLQFVGGSGPCRLFGEDGDRKPRVNRLSSGRLIAGTFKGATQDSDCNASLESWSLKSRNKSRADLWAFASLVAIEHSIERQNEACDGNKRGQHHGPSMCIQNPGEDGCKVVPKRPLIFKTGRKDCKTTKTPLYLSEDEEIHPDEHYNGTMTVKFMETYFNFSAKETVAIMGAHTLGRFHQRKSGHKYVWTTDWAALNNQYYRNVAGKDDWFFDDEECTKVGDAWGNKGKAVWIAKMNQVYRTGAPIQWIQKKVVCPNCADKSYERGGRNPSRLDLDRDCCMNKPANAFCRPDGNGPEGSKVHVRDDDFSWGCEYSHFIFGRDETALSVDMGLMYKFDVDRKGFPSGCPGLAGFHPSGVRWSDYKCGIDGKPWFTDMSMNWDHPNLTRVTVDNDTAHACPADCDKQDYQYPGDNLTLSKHVERYADDQAAWIADFFPVMEKMLANGYKEDDLVVSSLTGDAMGWRRLAAETVPEPAAKQNPPFFI